MDNGIEPNSTFVLKQFLVSVFTAYVQRSIHSLWNGIHQSFAIEKDALQVDQSGVKWSWEGPRERRKQELQLKSCLKHLVDKTTPSFQPSS